METETRLNFLTPADTADRFKARAKTRGLNQGEYLDLLVQFHDEARIRADAGDAGVKALLESLPKLQTVVG